MWFIEAMQWLDLPHTSSHPLRRSAIYLLIKLAAESNEFPPSLFVHGVDIGPVRDPCASGGFADIFRGYYNTTAVAVKRLRIYDLPKAETYKVGCCS